MRRTPPAGQPDVVGVVADGLLRACGWWRTELLTVAVLGAGAGWLTVQLGPVPAGVLTAATVALVVATPVTRRLGGRCFAAERARRRWHRAVHQTALPALHGRPTDVVRARPVPAGDLLTVAVPVGSAVADLQARADVLAAALGVRDLRIVREPANARLARVLVLRRDPLGDPTPVGWPWAGKAVTSLWEPVPVAVDETGVPVTISLPERNLLLGGEPGAGKSLALSLLLAAAALDPTVHVWLLDGKRVELAAWNPIARATVGPNVDDAVDLLRSLQQEMEARYEQLLDRRLRKVDPDCGLALHVLACDELAFYLHTGDRKTATEVANLTRDLVARGRAAGIIVLAATQKPSVDIVPSSLRDLFAFRWALRCTTPQASDTILGAGWAAQGHAASDVDPTHKGVGYLLAEGGTPTRCRAAYLDDTTLTALADRAAALRQPQPAEPPHAFSGDRP